ncbi:MAG: hypothetical protein CVU39_17085, partial [Chloroflexi bacterium HGW-Chloroflexi-10]
MLQKKVITRILAIFVIFSIMWSIGKTEKVYAEDWVAVTNATGFDAIRYDLTLNYRLMADIDLSDYPNWVPIGTESTPFIGVLDGNGKVITGLKLTNTTGSVQGLFGAIGSGATVSDLTVSNAAITAGDIVGVLAGQNSGDIIRCNVSGNIAGESYVGGLVGKNLVSTGNISRSYSTATVSGKGYVGGLAGSNAGSISESYAASPILASVFSNYVQFDGEDDYISIPNKLAYQTDSFTLEAWVQWDPANIDEDSSDVQFIIGKGVEQFEIHTEGGSGKNGIRFIPLPRTSIVSETEEAYHDVLNVIQPGWFHVASSWDFNTKTVRVYVNGVAQEIYHFQPPSQVNAGTEPSVALKDPNTNPFASNTADLFIGRRSDMSFPFKGKIADVRFWNIVRTGGQI